MSTEYQEEKVTSPINGSENCFKVFNETDAHYLCMSTGYMASSNFTMEDENFQKQMDNSPELVKALQHYDDDTGLVWIPTVLNMGEKGIIYPDGKANDWYWHYAKVVDVPEEERDQYDGHKKRLDLENTEKFGQFEFIDACKAMGIMLENSGDKLRLN